MHIYTSGLSLALGILDGSALHSCIGDFRKHHIHELSNTANGDNTAGLSVFKAVRLHGYSTKPIAGRACTAAFLMRGHRPD